MVNIGFTSCIDTLHITRIPLQQTDHVKQLHNWMDIIYQQLQKD